MCCEQWQDWRIFLLVMWNLMMMMMMCVCVYVPDLPRLFVRYVPYFQTVLIQNISRKSIYSKNLSDEWFMLKQLKFKMIQNIYIVVICCTTTIKEHACKYLLFYSDLNLIFHLTAWMTILSYLFHFHCFILFQLIDLLGYLHLLNCP